MSKFLFAILLLLISTASHAQMDIDQADTLNFEAFHTEKEDAIKLPGSTEDQPSQQAKPASATKSPTSTKPPPANNNSSGKLFEISARYTPAALNKTRSDKTTHSSVSSAIDSLHQQMAQLCPQGWTKLGEKSLPIESELYLYYEFRCF